MWLISPGSALAVPSTTLCLEGSGDCHSLEQESVLTALLAKYVADGMNSDRTTLLAERHRKVLRLYRERYRLKEIARKLSLSEHSVNTYLTEAVQILGTPGRQAAADLLARHEAPSQESRYRVSAGETATVVELSAREQGLDKPTTGVGILPLRRRDGEPNRLPAHVRLLWIVALLLLLITGITAAVAIYLVNVRPMEQLFR